MSAGRLLRLDKFVLRQFHNPSYTGTRIFYDPELFEEKVNEYYRERLALEVEFRDKPALVQGYADFCKHLFVPNFTGARLSTLQITEANEHLLRTRYEARTEKELPVLVRYFPLELMGGAESFPVARYLDIILYSREQCIKEALAMGEDPPKEPAPWRVVSVKAQDEPYETPMQPITIMRNAILTEGGSGVPFDRELYLHAVEYWKTRAVAI
jgi:hypothetical protein